MMLRSSWCPPPKQMDKKTAQFFVCKMYLLYRNTRKIYNLYGTDMHWDTMNENWNNLKMFKEYYYEILYSKK